MALVVSTMSCGWREDFEDHARPDREDPALVGIHDLPLDAYPQTHRFELRAGQGPVPLGVEVTPGMPMRIEVRGLSGESAWGDGTGRAGPGAPAPLRAHGAVLLRVGSKELELGSQTVLRVGQRARPEIAVNVRPSGAPAAFEVLVGWGEPDRPYDPQLDALALRPGQGEPVEMRVSRDASGAREMRELGSGERLWVQPPAIGRVQGDDRLPFPRVLPGAWVGRAQDGQSVVMDRPRAWTLGQGGAARLLPNWPEPSELPAPSVERFSAVGTRVELLPIHTLPEIETLELRVEPRRFVQTDLEVAAGDLVRIEVRGENQLRPSTPAAVHNVGVFGGLRETPWAMRNGDRGWLVPGGRERALYARVGQSVIELVGSDAFYAPEEGFIEIGVNQCFDGGDWPAYTQCRRRLEDWTLALRVTVGVHHGN